MGKAPHLLRDFDREGFFNWLYAVNATLAEPTNEYEVIRYRRWGLQNASRPETHIVYRRGDGTLTYTGNSRQDYEDFINGN
jgi:hypothetical protein